MVNVLGFPRAFRASDPEPMDEVRILVRLGNLTSFNSEIIGGHPARYYVMDINHVSPIACTTIPTSSSLPLLTEVVAYQRHSIQCKAPGGLGKLRDLISRPPNTFNGPRTDCSIRPTCHRAH
jgi:hypothetical protein